MDNQTDQTQTQAEQPATVAPDQTAAQTPAAPAADAPATDVTPAQPDPAQPVADQVEQARVHMDVVLNLLRDKRSQLQPGHFGGRELSEAITQLETGCMWMIRSLFADQPYSPLTRLQPATE